MAQFTITARNQDGPIYLVTDNFDTKKSLVWDDDKKDFKGEPMNTGSILSRGYWKPFRGILFRSGKISEIVVME